MEYPQAKAFNKFSPARVAILAMCVCMAAFSIGAQTKDAVLSPGVSIEQCRNGGSVATDVQCAQLGGNVGWVPGNAGDNNSHWSEDEFISYRALMTDLTTNTPHTIVLGYDIFENGKHAIDYLGTYNATETDSNPCSGVLPACAGPTTTGAIPLDTVTIPATITQKPGVFTLFGGTIDQASIMYVTCPTQVTIRRCISITFTPSVENPVLAWGGHIAWRGDWGAGNSAGGINGSSYHMRLISLDGQGGNQDLSLSASSVGAPGAVRIIKVVETAAQSSTQAFTFSTGFNRLPATFDLIDDNAGPGIDNVLSLPINGAATFTVSETNTGTFTFLRVQCDDTNSGEAPAQSALINVAAGEVVTCTFYNGVSGPSAAPASISGRAVTSFGYGIGGARVLVTNAATGEVSFATTSPFGYYTVGGLPVGDFYIVTISHKRYAFSDNTRTFSLNEDLAEMDFVANP